MSKRELIGYLYVGTGEVYMVKAGYMFSLITELELSRRCRNHDLVTIKPM